MNLALLILKGEDSALDVLVRDIPLPICSRWRKGDTKRNGAAFSSSGLNMTLADAQNPRELANRIGEFLLMCRENRITFFAPNVAAEIAIALTVGDSKQFVASLGFSSAELLSIGEIGLTLSVTAYPTSDAANAD